ncbi:MAG: 2-hydroxyacyl-CoA dehydratase family protein, partial [Adlercreutzia equolifaciens]
PYIDAVESYGLPADTCPVPTSESGSAIVDALPHCGLGFISTSTPCDGSDMATSFQDRRLKQIGLPTYPLTLPVRYDDEDTVECGAQDMWHCIKWVEEITGEKWDWEHYFTVIRRFNEQTKMEMEKWEMNSTPYPQLIGPCYELFRKWNYEMDGGLEPSVMKTFYKVRKLMYQSYEEKCNPYRHPMKYRAVVWSCPAHYYANFSNWLANAWGMGVLVEMESLNFTKQLETEDHEEAIRDLARLYERMVMRKHTNGGYVHVLDELWKVCEQFNANFIIMYQHVCCKTMAVCRACSTSRRVSAACTSSGSSTTSWTRAPSPAATCAPRSTTTCAPSFRRSPRTRACSSSRTTSPGNVSCDPIKRLLGGRIYNEVLRRMRRRLHLHEGRYTRR